MIYSADKEFADSCIQSAVNASKSIWKPVTSGVTQGADINIFINNIDDDGLECILSKYVDDTKLRGVIDTPEGKDTTQRDRDRLEKCAQVVLMK